MDMLKKQLAFRVPLNRALRLVRDQVAARIETVPLPASLLDAEPRAKHTAFARYAYMSGPEKTEAMIGELARAIRAKESTGHSEPVSRRRDPDAMIVELTTLRQAIDLLGIPYDFYANEALRYLIQKRGPETPETPEIKDLFAQDVLDFVAGRWGSPQHRIWYQPGMKGWDRRFGTRRLRGTDEHNALHEFIAQRVADAQASGRVAAAELRQFLGVWISEAEAMRRFGVELVDLASKPGDPLENVLHDLS